MPKWLRSFIEEQRKWLRKDDREAIPLFVPVMRQSASAGRPAYNPNRKGGGHAHFGRFPGQGTGH